MMQKSGFEFWVSLSIVFALLLKSFTCQDVPGYSIEVKSTVNVQEGLCVTIPCKFNASSKNVFKNSGGSWLKNPVLPATFVATNVKSRHVIKENFHLTGNPDNGDCTLTINSAKKEDIGTYYFRHEDSKNWTLSYSFQNPVVRVNVIELSDKPEISLVGRIVAGEEVTLNCTSPGRCSGKAPLITWEGNIEKYGTTQTYIEKNDDGTMTYYASLTFIPWIEDDQSLVTCMVTFGSNVTTSSNITLNVTGQTISCPVCRPMDSFLITGMVVGNIVILILMILGSYCFLKKHAEKKQLENGTHNYGPKEERTESIYQDLMGQQDSTYYNIKME
ncbi:sialic acid-binding Ig-like lectin 13 isoform X2 [Dendrobates tinctorius]|uniref:sialic acid-binding Ig-like lectin 13 isoform X2 n=1 Tax=Dendrobates tinctorius TaxID=92724 RepID=UPI003CC987BE